MAKSRRGYVEVDLSRVARLQKIAFWIVYWKTSGIATVVGGAAEANRHAYNTRRRDNRFHPSSVGYGLGAALNETHGYCTGYRTPLN